MPKDQWSADNARKRAKQAIRDRNYFGGEEPIEDGPDAAAQWLAKNEENILKARKRRCRKRK
jgi:hypothetical protein